MFFCTSRHPIMINMWQQFVAKVIALTRQEPEPLPQHTDNFLPALIRKRGSICIQASDGFAPRRMRVRRGDGSPEARVSGKRDVRL